MQPFTEYSHGPYVAVVRFWLAYSGAPERFADQVAARQPGHVTIDA